MSERAPSHAEVSKHREESNGFDQQCQDIIAQYEQPRSALLPLAHLFQQRDGYVSQDAMREISRKLDLSLAVVESTVSFYTLFYRKPVGKYMLQPCRGLACQLNGADAIHAYFREKLGIGHLQTTPDGTFSYEEVECLAACDRATCMQVNLEFVYDLTPEKIDDMLAAMRAGTYETPPLPQTAQPGGTWLILQDAQVSMGSKSPGALDQPMPNNAGGLDKDGIIMLDRILTNEARYKGRTKERLANVEPQLAQILEHPNGAGH
jgi:NADH:ubiquinone oxidoreductase subunit E